MIRFLKIFINNDWECSVCYEKCNGIRNLLYCKKYGHSVCETCIKQIYVSSKQKKYFMSVEVL